MQATGNEEILLTIVPGYIENTVCIVFVSIKKNLYSFSNETYTARSIALKRAQALSINSSTIVSLRGDIPGVFVARQKRSVRIRDRFINVGVEALNENRLKDLTVADLCQRSGNSVGAFYTRFQDKDAFFRALRVYTIESLEHEVISRFDHQSLTGNDAHEVLEKLVDLMVDIFTSRFRGVLRESLLLILEPNDPWAPMRESALKIVSVLQQSLEHAYPNQSIDDTHTRCRFCFQLIVGALQNDLVNDYHVFTTKDQSLRNGLKEAVCAYMDKK